MQTPLDEPARGGFPDIGLLALPGRERTNIGTDQPKFPPPPIHHLFGLTPTGYSDSGSTFTMPASPWLQTHAGVFMAGVSALVADAPLGSAIIRGLPPGAYGTTSQLALSYQRPVTVESKELTARASAVDVGRAIGLSESVVEDAHGRLIALATSRYYLTTLDPLPPLPEVWIPEEPAYDTPPPWDRPLPADLDVSPRPELTGLEWFRAGIAGAIDPPPFAQLFGITLRSADEGRLVATTRASKWFCSPAGTIYGGVLAFLADFAMTSAGVTTLPPHTAAATLDMTLHFVRPCLPTEEELTLTGEVVHRGRTLIVATTKIENAAGKVVVTGSGSMRVLAGRGWDDVSPADLPIEDEDA